MSGEINRPRGVFTVEQRRWLRGDRDGHNLRYQARDRLLEAMRDISLLVDAVVAGNDWIPADIFAKYDTEAEQSRQELASDLIALAFILTNDPIDYSSILGNIHPRKEHHSPTDPDRPSAGGPFYDIETAPMLAFRDSLSTGIRTGKQAIEPDPSDIPRRIAIDANTLLFKEPTHARLQEAIDMEVRRDIFAEQMDRFYQDYHPETSDTPPEIEAESTGENDDEDDDDNRPSYIDKVYPAIRTKLSRKISEKRENNNSQEMIRHHNSEYTKDAILIPAEWVEWQLSES